jgi:two-component system response regulator MprA
MTRVLVVDDDPAIRAVVADALSWEGYDVLVAGDGREALGLIGRERPDMVLLDLMMPVMTGAEFARAYHKVAQPPAIPIVVLSAAHGLADLEEELRPFGVSTCIAKPFDLVALMATVERYARLALG